jgi:hypothetical protein
VPKKSGRSSVPGAAAGAMTGATPRCLCWQASHPLFSRRSRHIWSTWTGRLTRKGGALTAGVGPRSNPGPYVFLALQQTSDPPPLPGAEVTPEDGHPYLILRQQRPFLCTGSGRQFLRCGCGRYQVVKVGELFIQRRAGSRVWFASFR